MQASRRSRGGRTASDLEKARSPAWCAARRSPARPGNTCWRHGSAHQVEASAALPPRALGEIVSFDPPLATAARVGARSRGHFLFCHRGRSEDRLVVRG